MGIAGLSMVLIFLWSMVSGIGVSLGHFVILAGHIVGTIIVVLIYFQQRLKIHHAVQRVISVRDECAQELLNIHKALRGF